MMVKTIFFLQVEVNSPISICQSSWSSSIFVPHSWLGKVRNSFTQCIQAFFIPNAAVAVHWFYYNCIPFGILTSTHGIKMNQSDTS